MVWSKVAAVGWALFLGSVVAETGQTWAAQPGPKMLLEAVDMTVTELSEKAARRLDQIKKSPAVIGDVTVVRLDGKSLEDTDASLVINLPGGGKLEMKGYKVIKSGETTKLEWKNGKGMANLVLTGESAYGLIYNGDKVYSVEPLGKNLHALHQVDQTKLKDK
jgi:hypothetical protein